MLMQLFMGTVLISTAEGTKLPGLQAGIQIQAVWAQLLAQVRRPWVPEGLLAAVYRCTSVFVFPGGPASCKRLCVACILFKVSAPKGARKSCPPWPWRLPGAPVS